MVNNPTSACDIYDPSLPLTLINPALWNKLYKSTLFDNIRYKEGFVHEDEFIYRSIMEQCNKIAIINEPLTFHRIRSGSIMTNYSVHNLECNLQWMQLEIEYYKTHHSFPPDISGCQVLSIHSFLLLF